MTRENIPTQVAQWILSVSSSKWVFLLLVNALLLVVGTFMETNAAIIILAPILMPVVHQFNIDPVHFGIVMFVNLAIGMITPPLGVNLYVAAGLKEGVKVDQVINKHLIIYLLAMISVLLILTFVPGISTLIPSLLATTN